ncbi:sulfatase-like hydrolase/transferase [Akkermansiaceae bacterium]|nr:sulfatase-like hydrolase/transferase [Akkermansiaceae bacterium]MDB4508277.1 sulfatase-like hydrolase/transferase [Akkermansiaceae bacterium]
MAPKGDPSYNSGWINTPALDAMAAEGLRFDRFYSASAVCSPTRASCLTGRHPLRVGIPHANQGSLGADETPLSEVLSGVGYTTGHFGKWHMGTLTTLRSDSNRGADGNTADYSAPWQHGYDNCFVTEAKVPTFHPMRRAVNGLPEPVSFTDPNFHGTYYWTPPANPADWPTAAEGTPVDVTDNLSGDDSRVVMDRVIPFLQGAVADGDPFFTVVWLHTPHRDVVDPHGLSGVDSADAYTDAIVGMDTQIARLRAELETLGVTDNTMFWFCSDNGPEEGVGRSGPYRARKRSLHEGGVRVPGILVWPDKIPAPRTTDFPSVTSDYYPTILDYLCIEVPEQKPVDGISLRGVIENTATEREQPIGFNFLAERSWVDQRYKLISKDNGNTFELYDLIADESETTNIAAGNSSIVARMTLEFEAWQTAVDTDVAYIPPPNAPSVELSTTPGAVDGPFEVNVVFSENVTELIADDFDIANGTATELTGSNDTYTLTVTPTSAGLVTISLPAGSAQDEASNPTLVSNSLNVFFGSADVSILIDFGRVDNQTTDGNFNNIYGTGTTVDTPSVELIDSEGANTGITLNSDFSAGGSWAGTQADYAGPYPDEVAGQPVTAIQDSMFIRSPATSLFTLAGLAPGTAYDILIYGARSNNGGPNAEWTFTDNTGDTTLSFDVFNNNTEVALFQGLVPDANNALTLVYTSSDDGSTPRGAMNFMQITAGSAAGTSSLEITSLEVQLGVADPTYTVTWNSIPNRDYLLSYSTDLEVWEEVDDSISSGGVTTSYAYELRPSFIGLIDAPALFYRVELVE